MPQMSHVLRERAIGMLTAGMSTRAVALELNVHFSTVSHLQRRFREFGSTSNRFHNRRPMCIHTSPGPPHPASSPPSSSETSHPDSCCNNRFVQPKNFCTNCQKPSQRSSSACSSSSSGYLTWLQFVVVSWLEWANAYIRWRLALWRGVLFMDESRFSLYRAEGRQHVCVVWMIGLLNVVDLVAHGGGGVMVWAGVCYGQHHM